MCPIYSSNLRARNYISGIECVGNTVYWELNACVKRMRIVSFDCMHNLLTRVDLTPR